MCGGAGFTLCLTSWYVLVRAGVRRRTPPFAAAPGLDCGVCGVSAVPEVCEVSLDVQVQDGGGSGGAQRRTVLAQQVLELLTDLPGRQREGVEEGGGWVEGSYHLSPTQLSQLLLPPPPPPPPSFEMNHHGGLTWWPGPSSCVRCFPWLRCVASPGVPPPPYWGTPSRRCSRSPSPGGAPHLRRETRRETSERRRQRPESPGGLTFHQRGEQRHVGGFPPTRRQVEPQTVELLPETPSSVLRLGSVDKRLRGHTYA